MKKTNDTKTLLARLAIITVACVLGATADWLGAGIWGLFLGWLLGSIGLKWHDATLAK